MKPVFPALHMASPVNPLFFQSALCALSNEQLFRIPDTPAFAVWPESSKMLVLEEMETRTCGPRPLAPPADPIAA